MGTARRMRGSLWPGVRRVPMMARMAARYVLGMNKYDHDVSVVLLRDGVPIVGIPKERITREKWAAGAPDAAIGYCLKTAGIGLKELSAVVQNSYAMKVEDLEHALLSRDHDYHLPRHERELALGSTFFRNPQLYTLSHHLAHAYSAFAMCPFDEGAVMVMDGVGQHRRDVQDAVPPGQGDAGHPCDRESESYYVFRGRELECVRKVWLPVARGVLSDDFTRMSGGGAMYSRVSQYIFAHWNKCGEVMGLAPFGGPDDRIPRLVEATADGTWTLDLWPEHLCNPYIPQESKDHADWEESEHLEEWQNLAWRVQDDLEELMLRRARELHERTGMKNLVLAGGIALNCVANGRVATEGPFENVWVQPAAGDTGISLGCAYFGELELLKQERSFVMVTDKLGRSYDDDEIDEALAEKPWKSFINVRRSTDVAAECAAQLADGQVVGWFQGGAEFGPRSLGHRSILCDPRDEGAKERLNAQVKHRQAFRPFAPAVLAEKADEWFEPGPSSAHMLFVRTVREDKRALVPSIVHCDGTARLQTVTQEDDPEFHALLTAFDAITGVPILVNTSFNVKGEPIVESPEDALHCYLGTDMDLLVLVDRFITKTGMFKRFRHIVGEMSRLRDYKTVGDLLRLAATRFAER